MHFRNTPLLATALFFHPKVNNRIRISYILEKAAATLGSIGLMIVITEHYVLPTIHPILPAQTLGMTFAQKLGELGWVLMDMIFPYLPIPVPRRPCSPPSPSTMRPPPVLFPMRVVLSPDPVSWILGFF